MNIRCKFKVQSVKEMDWPLYAKDPAKPNQQLRVDGKFGQEVELTAVCGGDKSSSENESFSSATPDGKLTFMVTNPNVAGALRPGDYYYIDLTKAE